MTAVPFHRPSINQRVAHLSRLWVVIDVSPSFSRCTSVYYPSPVPTPLVFIPIPPSHSPNLVTYKSPVCLSSCMILYVLTGASTQVPLPLSADTFRYLPIPLWSPKPSDIGTCFDLIDQCVAHYYL